VSVEAEIHEELFHKKGALAAARKGDRVNPEKRSNGSQFYVVQGKKYTRKDLRKLEERIRARREGFSFSEEQLEVYSSEGGAPHLDGAYTVFGQLVEGMEVLDRIAAVQTGPSNRPKERIEMEVEVIE
jgi:peptidyl-prolyl cis-trans isomerase B (cyclophilin B)